MRDSPPVRHVAQMGQSRGRQKGKESGEIGFFFFVIIKVIKVIKVMKVTCHEGHERFGKEMLHKMAFLCRLLTNIKVGKKSVMSLAGPVFFTNFAVTYTAGDSSLKSLW